jgi:small-conductance mechanosensitive channel
MASPWLPDVVNAMPVTLAFAFVAVVITAIVSLVQRFRHGDSVTRAQLKWFVLGALCWLPVLLYPGDHGNGGVIDVLLGLALAAVPLAMAMAILRYRLYDIDRIISRTASYTVVTVTVLAVYAVIVTAATRFLPSSNTLAVAGATLAAAALVRPLLHRVQELVDRRFNRSHYDAEHTVDAFAHTIAHTVDCSDVNAALDAAVTTSLQPTRYTVWTRPA